jgi:cyclopropane-fatty-acyl-phospholipid synthase
MFDTVMSRLIRTGRLTVIHPDGSAKSYGAVSPDNRHLDITLRLNTHDVAGKIVADPYLHFGEAYTSGEVSVENGSLWDLLDVLGRNLRNLPPSPRWMRLWNRFMQNVVHNDPHASRRNVAHHYDLSDQLYRTFLDEDLQYSCAYFSRADMSLEEAQLAKKRHLIAKLDLKAGQSVLDIGCGWGGMALEIARTANVRVKGITLSQEQLAVARDRAKAAGLDGRVTFELIDYREVAERFDRIISVGMFEHVGKADFGTYFARIRELLKDSGVAVVHSIARRGTSGGSNSWIRKYIFPGGYLPTVSEASRAVEDTDLWLTDVEILRLHYAETLKAWRERFLGHRDEMVALYDERFVRMWEFYLASCEMSFRHGDLMVMQMQLTRQVDALSVTRDYMVDRERELNGAGGLRRSA